jgi:hypothetical protein
MQQFLPKTCLKRCKLLTKRSILNLQVPQIEVNGLQAVNHLGRVEVALEAVEVLEVAADLVAEAAQAGKYIIYFLILSNA